MYICTNDKVSLWILNLCSSKRTLIWCEKSCFESVLQNVEHPVDVCISHSVMVSPELKKNTKTITLKQPWNVLAVSDMQFCLRTPPTAETFQCFISRIVRRLKQNNFVYSKRNLFYCFISVLLCAVSWCPSLRQRPKFANTPNHAKNILHKIPQKLRLDGIVLRLWIGVLSGKLTDRVRVGHTRGPCCEISSEFIAAHAIKFDNKRRGGANATAPATPPTNRGTPTKV